jgi:NAD(P)H-quinone oxidoreductase subunit 5
LQFIRAPTLLHDYHLRENAIGAHLPGSGALLAVAGPAGAGRPRGWLYRFALERGYLDALLAEYVVGPFVRLFRRCDALERRWTNFLTPGGASREPELVRPQSVILEDLA